MSRIRSSERPEPRPAPRPSALDVFHRDEADAAVVVIDFVDFVDDGDVRMIEGRGGARLGEQTARGVGLAASPDDLSATSAGAADPSAR